MMQYQYGLKGWPVLTDARVVQPCLPNRYLTPAYGECPVWNPGKRSLLDPATADGTDTIPRRVDEALRSPAQPLDTGTRAFLEPRFGHDFSRVRIHAGDTAARSAQALGANAFASGHDIVFGKGRYAPGTPKGRQLLAHELAHVVQQSGSAGPCRYPGNPLAPPSGFLVQRDQAEPGEESGLSKKLRALLPGKVGPLTYMSQVITLSEVIGDVALEKFLDLVLADKEARAFVKDHGVPGIVALHDTMTARNLSVSKAREAISRNPLRYSHTAMEFRAGQRRIAESGQAMQETSTAAEVMALEGGKTQPSIQITTVSDLDPRNIAGLAASVKKIEQLLPVFESGIKLFAAVTPGIKTAETGLLAARKFSQGTGDEEFHLRMRQELFTAETRCGEVLDAIQKTAAYFDIYDEWKNIEGVRNGIRGFLSLRAGGQHRDPYATLSALLETLRKGKTSLDKKKTRAEKIPDAIRRISFVVRYFMAVNDPQNAPPPAAGEREKFRGSLFSLSDDFQLVYPADSTPDAYRLFLEYAAVLDKQLAVKKGMNAAKAASPLIPSQQDVIGYFHSLAGKSNGEVIAAYVGYADAFFYHRITRSLEDVETDDLSRLFQHKQTISGTRALVCSGYALLGSELLKSAGGTHKKYLVAARASDAAVIEESSFDDVHVAAKVNRKGSSLYVTNQFIVGTSDAAIGPYAVAWHNRDNPVYLGEGKTIGAAIADLKKWLSKKRIDLLKKTQKMKGTKTK